MKKAIIFMIAASTVCSSALASSLTCWVVGDGPVKTKSSEEVDRSGWNLVERNGTSYRLTYERLDEGGRSLERPNLRLDTKGGPQGGVVVISDGNRLSFIDNNVSIFCNEK